LVLTVKEPGTLQPSSSLKEQVPLQSGVSGGG